MKTATAYYPVSRPIPFPNAATRRQLLQRLLDKLLMVACCFGITAMIMLALVLF